MNSINAENCWVWRETLWSHGYFSPGPRWIFSRFSPRRRYPSGKSPKRRRPIQEVWLSSWTRLPPWICWSKRRKNISAPPRCPDFFPGMLRNRCFPWFFTWAICGNVGLISRRSFKVWMSGMEPISSSPSKDEGELRAFIGAMNVVAKPLAPRVVSAIGPGSSRALLDVGGAMGTYTLAFLEAAPGMKATIFDRPDVIELARKHLGDAGVPGRVTLVLEIFIRTNCLAVTTWPSSPLLSIRTVPSRM